MDIKIIIYLKSSAARRIYHRLAGNVIQLSIRALILEGFENLPSHLPKTFHSRLHKSMRSFRKGVRENPFSKGFSP
jgi:hypothetical protein